MSTFNASRYNNVSKASEIKSDVVYIQTQINSNDHEIASLNSQISGIQNSFTIDCTNVDSTVDNKLNISNHVNTHSFFHNCIEFKASDANYRSYYCGLLGDNTTNNNQFCICGSGGSGDDPNVIAAFDDGGNTYFANNLYLDQTLQCNQVTFSDGNQTNAFTSTLKTNVDNNTLKTTDIIQTNDFTSINDCMFLKNGDIGTHVTGAGIGIGLVSNATSSVLNGQDCILGRLNGYLPIVSRANGNNESIVFGNYDDGDQSDIITGAITSQGRWIVGADINRYIDGYRLYVDGTTRFSDSITLKDNKIQNNAFTMDHEVILASVAYQTFERGFEEFAYPNNIILSLTPTLSINTEYGNASTFAEISLGALTNPGILFFKPSYPNNGNPDSRWNKFIPIPTVPDFNHDGGGSDPNNPIPSNPDGLPFTVSNSAYNSDIVLNGYLLNTGWHEITFSVQAENMHWIKSLLGRIEIKRLSDDSLYKTSFWGGFDADSQVDHKSFYAFEVSLSFYCDQVDEFAIHMQTKYWYYTASANSVVIGKVVVKRM